MKGQAGETVYAKRRFYRDCMRTAKVLVRLCMWTTKVLARLSMQNEGCSETVYASKTVYANNEGSSETVYVKRSF